MFDDFNGANKQKLFQLVSAKNLHINWTGKHSSVGVLLLVYDIHQHHILNYANYFPLSYVTPPDSQNTSF